MTEALDSTIEEAAAAPKSAKGDQGEMEAHPLKDLVEVDRYLASNRAVAKVHKGMRFNQLKPPGTA